MANPEIETDILKSTDVSGVSEKQTDLQIDRRQHAGPTAKQQNRMTKNTTKQATTDPDSIGADVFTKKSKEKTSDIIFES